MSAGDVAALARATAALEEWPDGTYGGARPLRPPYVPGEPDPAAAAHVQELLKELGTWRVGARPELAARAQQLPAEAS